MEFTTLGALVGLIIAIILIIKKVHPAYSLILGALIGGIVGGGGLTGTVGTMVSGAQSMMSSVLRILTSGILAGALIKTGAAEKIADVIVKKLGQRFALVSVAVATMIICAVGVFVDISVIISIHTYCNGMAVFIKLFIQASTQSSFAACLAVFVPTSASIKSPSWRKFPHIISKNS